MCRKILFKRGVTEIIDLSEYKLDYVQRHQYRVEVCYEDCCAMRETLSIYYTGPELLPGGNVTRIAHAGYDVDMALTSGEWLLFCIFGVVGLACCYGCGCLSSLLDDRMIKFRTKKLNELLSKADRLVDDKLRKLHSQNIIDVTSQEIVQRLIDQRAPYPYPYPYPDAPPGPPPTVSSPSSGWRPGHFPLAPPPNVLPPDGPNSPLLPQCPSHTGSYTYI